MCVQGRGGLQGMMEGRGGKLGAARVISHDDILGIFGSA